MLRTVTTIAGLLLCGSALAQQPFTDLEACRIDDEKVALTAAYMGGACDEPQQAEVSGPRGTVARVTIPTERTAEMCTMQLVEITTSAVLSLSALVAELDVTALDPDGREVADGRVEIVEDRPCEEEARP